MRPSLLIASALLSLALSWPPPAARADGDAAPPPPAAPEARPIAVPAAEPIPAPADRTELLSQLRGLVAQNQELLQLARADREAAVAAWSAIAQAKPSATVVPSPGTPAPPAPAAPPAALPSAQSQAVQAQPAQVVEEAVQGPGRVIPPGPIRRAIAGLGDALSRAGDTRVVSRIPRQPKPTVQTVIQRVSVPAAAAPSQAVQTEPLPPPAKAAPSPQSSFSAPTSVPAGARMGLFRR